MNSSGQESIISAMEDAWDESGTQEWWFCRDGNDSGEIKGPFTPTEMELRFRKGLLHAETLVRWIPVAYSKPSREEQAVQDFAPLSMLCEDGSEPPFSSTSAQRRGIQLEYMLSGRSEMTGAVADISSAAIAVAQDSRRISTESASGRPDGSSTLSSISYGDGSNDLAELAQNQELVHTMQLAGGRKIRFACVSRIGEYPMDPDHENQDAHIEVPRLAEAAEFIASEATLPEADTRPSDCALFAVFDGHGAKGHIVSSFCRRNLPIEIAKFAKGGGGDAAALHAACVKGFLQTDESADDDEAVPTQMSGTTAVAALLTGEVVHVANLGDSRAILGVWGEDGQIEGSAISEDHVPLRRDEYDRVKAAGARCVTAERWILCGEGVNGVCEWSV